MWIPKTLYEALPYLYAGAGALAMSGLDGPVAMVSGLILVCAGGIVWMQRRSQRGRRGQLRRAEAVPAGFEDAVPTAGFTRLVWREEYGRGHPLIDAQHRGLLEASNALLSAVAEGESRADVELMLDDLIAHIEAHFSVEEGVLAALRRPLPDEHLRDHRTLLAGAKSLAERFRNGQLPVGELFLFITRDVVSGHLMREDLGCLADAG
jgi:hemerythrin-like metal-binding protein